MEAESTDQTEEDKRQRILVAARERFTTYGFVKTTMAELASDTCMSAANLYRYFDNKHDIAAACAQQCMDEQTNLLRDLVRQPGISAIQKLENYVLSLLHHTYESYSSTPRINEMVELIVRQRPDIVHDKMRLQQSMLAEILAQGNESGEFDVADVLTAAATVQVMTTMFHVPIFMGLHAYDELETKARNTITLMLKGLAKR